MAKTMAHRAAVESGEMGVADACKRDLRSFTPAARFPRERKKADIRPEEYTGLAPLDFDHIPTEEVLLRVYDALRRDEHVAMAYRTVSGHGLRAIVRIDMTVPVELADACSPDELREAMQALYADYYRFLMEVYSELTALKLDGACKDASRLSFLSHDPEVYFNPEAQAYGMSDVVERRRLKEAAARPAVAEKPKVRHAGGRPSKFEKDDAACLTDAVRWAEQKGHTFARGSRNDFVSVVAFQMNRYGVAEQEAERLLCLEYGARDEDFCVEEIAGVVRRCFAAKPEEYNTVQPPHVTRQKNNHHRGGSRNNASTSSAAATAADDASKLRTQREIYEAALAACALRYNTLTGRLEYRPTPSSPLIPTSIGPTLEDMPDESAALADDGWLPMTDRDVNTLYGYLQLIDPKLSPARLDQTLQSKVIPNFAPVQAFCAGLPEWDGVDRVHEMFACFGLQFADELDLEKYFHKWFLGFMNCALGRKGKYNELILGIVGPQGVGKTTFFHRLLPEPLQRYMAEVSKELLDTKDTRIALTANLLMLADEVGLLEPKQFSMMNQLTTMDRVKERMAYAKLVEEMLRRASLCVTANEPNFLRSEHGSRRWVLLMVESVATERLEAVDKMQLFAQLLSEVRAGVLSQFMTAEEVAELSEFNFRHAKFLEARLFDLLFARVPEGERGEWFAIDEIFAHLESSAAHRALDPGILTKVLEHRGIPKKMTPAGERYFVLVKDGVHRESERHWNPFNEVVVA
jgi:hypothetical protein